MNRYRLVATLGPFRRTRTVWAVNDLDATISGALMVLDLATRDRVWAWGRVRLLNEHGTVLRRGC